MESSFDETISQSGILLDFDFSVNTGHRLCSKVFGFYSSSFFFVIDLVDKVLDSIAVSLFVDILVELTNIRRQDSNNYSDTETRCLVYHVCFIFNNMQREEMSVAT